MTTRNLGSSLFFFCFAVVLVNTDKTFEICALLDKRNNCVYTNTHFLVNFFRKLHTIHILYESCDSKGGAKNISVNFSAYTFTYRQRCYIKDAITPISISVCRNGEAAISYTLKSYKTWMLLPNACNDYSTVPTILCSVWRYVYFRNIGLYEETLVKYGCWHRNDIIFFHFSASVCGKLLNNCFFYPFILAVRLCIISKYTRYIYACYMCE